jgi:hypothetical protein
MCQSDFFGGDWLFLRCFFAETGLFLFVDFIKIYASAIHLIFRIAF